MLKKDIDKKEEEGEDRFRGIIENALDIITLIDEEGTIVYNSPAFARQLGYESWEALGRQFLDFVYEDDRAYVARQFSQMIAGAGTAGEALEFRFRHKDGRWRVLEAMVSNLLKHDLVRAVVLNSRDVTEHRESEAELEKYRVHLESLVEKRTQELTAALEKEKTVVEQQKIFISMVSHEFRTPLTIIDGNAQIIQRRGADLERPVLEKRAGTIRAAVGRLVRLIETILSAHTLESGRLEVTLAPCNLDGVIREVCGEQMEMTEREIKLDIHPEFPEMMLDEKVIRQIITNLLTNATKYSPQSSLVRVAAFQEGQQTAVIQVTDYGVGIPEDELPKIFTRYYRASTSGGIPGSGLGLSLVKQFVELHQGKIAIDSKVGVGTTVTVRLPMGGGVHS